MNICQRFSSELYSTERASHLLLASLLALALLLLCASNARSDFAMNFGPDGTMPITGNFAGTATINCNRGGGGGGFGGGCAGFGDDDGTPFYYNMVRDDNNNIYYHVVVGMPDDAFRQDVYIRMGTAWNGFGGDPSAPSDSGGDLGAGGSGGGFGGGFGGGCGFSGNGCDPLGDSNNNAFTGSASGNPARVIMAQVLETDPASSNNKVNATQGTFLQEFTKTQYSYTGSEISANKPMIKQTLTQTNAAQGNISLNFKADMSGVKYNNNSTPLTISNDMNASGVFVNNLSLTSLPGGGTIDSAVFDMSTDTQPGRSTVTAGRYTFTPGNEWSNGDPYSAGTYNYITGGFNQSSVDFSQYKDSSQ